MGFDLMNSFDAKAKKEGYGKEKLITISYPTGIDYFDYRNGKIENEDILVGINAGRLASFIGKPGTGKSTAAIQAGWNIVKDIENGMLIHFDFERATTPARIQALLGVGSEIFESKYRLFNSEISAQSFYRTVRGIAKIKEDNKEALMYDTGRLDSEGNPYFDYVPTVIINDSWSSMTSEESNDVENDDVTLNNMTGATTAKYNNWMINQLISVMEKYNITIIAVGQISTNINTGTPKPAQINYLKQDENIAGGTKFLFLSDTLIKFTASTKLDEEKDFGIKGFMSKLQIIKSRSNEAGREIELVYEQKTGFHNLLTNFNAAKKSGLLKGNGRRYYFDYYEGMSEYGFTQKKFVETYNTKPEFREMFDSMIGELFLQFIYKPELADSIEDGVTSDEQLASEEQE